MHRQHQGKNGGRSRSYYHGRGTSAPCDITKSLFSEVCVSSAHYTKTGMTFFRRTCEYGTLQLKEMPLTVLWFCREVTLNLQCLFDLQRTSATHLVHFLHRQQTPVSFSLLSSLCIRFFFFFLSIYLDFLFKCRRLISSGAFLPNLAPQLIVTGPSITQFCPLLLYAAESAAAKQSSWHAAKRTKPKRKPPSLVIASETLNKQSVSKASLKKSKKKKPESTRT